MSDAVPEPHSVEPRQTGEDDLTRLPEHPIGTLAIVLIFAGLFTLGWLLLYFGVFLPRGVPTS